MEMRSPDWGEEGKNIFVIAKSIAIRIARDFGDAISYVKALVVMSNDHVSRLTMVSCL